MRYEPNERSLELSVEELCRLAYRAGDDGDRLSPLLSWSPSEGYESEALTEREEHVYLSYTLESPDVEATIRIGGHADAVEPREDGAYTVEYRGATTRSGIPSRADRAALCCYGYFLCHQKKLPSVWLTLMIGEEACVNTCLSAERLKDVFDGLLERVWDTLQDRLYRETTVREAARDAVFPYETIRDSQADMIKECWRDLRRGQLIFAQAPTGIGKTISTLYPAVRCWGERRCDKIFYLTAKSSIRREVCTAVERLNLSGTPVRVCIIASKDSTCNFEQARAASGSVSRFCKSGDCPRLSGYHQRVGAALRELLQGEAPYIYYI